MLVDSGEVLRVENLLSDNPIDGAGDRVPRGTVVLFPISALVGVLLNDKEVVDGELGMFIYSGHLLPLPCLWWPSGLELWWSLCFWQQE